MLLGTRVVRANLVGPVVPRVALPLLNTCLIRQQKSGTKKTVTVAVVSTLLTILALTERWSPLDVLMVTVSGM